MTRSSMRRHQEEETTGDENAQEKSLEQGSSRSVPGERLQEEDATGGHLKRMKLQEVEAPGKENSWR